MNHDVIVIGSGFAGAVIAARLAERGARVLIVERGVWRGQAGSKAPPQPRRNFPRGPIGSESAGDVSFENERELELEGLAGTHRVYKVV